MKTDELYAESLALDVQLKKQQLKHLERANELDIEMKQLKIQKLKTQLGLLD